MKKPSLVQSAHLVLIKALLDRLWKGGVEGADLTTSFPWITGYIGAFLHRNSKIKGGEK